MQSDTIEDLFFIIIIILLSRNGWTVRRAEAKGRCLMPRAHLHQKGPKKQFRFVRICFAALEINPPSFDRKKRSKASSFQTFYPKVLTSFIKGKVDRNESDIMHSRDLVWAASRHLGLHKRVGSKRIWKGRSIISTERENKTKIPKSIKATQSLYP